MDRSIPRFSARGKVYFICGKLWHIHDNNLNFLFFIIYYIFFFIIYILNREMVKNNCKRNSGGLIIYIRDKYVSKETLVYKSEDDIVWVKLSKSLLALNDDLYICLCYVTPDDSSKTNPGRVKYL